MVSAVAYSILAEGMIFYFMSGSVKLKQVLSYILEGGDDRRRNAEATVMEGGAGLSAFLGELAGTSVMTDTLKEQAQILRAEYNQRASSELRRD